MAEGKGAWRLTGEGNIGELLVVPPASYVGVCSGEPDLLELGRAAVLALPEGRAESIARLVKTKGLESVFDLFRDLRVGEAPCEGMLVGIVKREMGNLLISRPMNANDGRRRNTQGPDRVPDAECLDFDLGCLVVVRVARETALFSVSNLSRHWVSAG